MDAQVAGVIRGLAAAHRDTYELLASEYESRAPLTPAMERVLSEFAGCVNGGGRVLELGCGVGEGLAVLGGAGLTVDGVDLSRAMVRRARLRNPGATVFVGDFMSGTPASTYDAVVALAFIHLFPSWIIQTVLGRIRDALRGPGRQLLLSTTATPQRGEGWEPKWDYPGSPLRYRVHWDPVALKNELVIGGFEVTREQWLVDRSQKTWIILQARVGAQGLGCECGAG